MSWVHPLTGTGTWKHLQDEGDQRPTDMGLLFPAVPGGPG